MANAYRLAEQEIGTYEWGDGHNPVVVQYFADVGHGWVQDDETAWCAAFVGSMLKRAGLPHTGELTARSYLDWGRPVELENAREGDLVVFWRGSRDGWQGHVGFFVGMNGDRILVLGGNQSNEVNVQGYSVDRLLGVRRMERTRVAQSTTVQALAVQVAAGAGAAASAVSALDGTAQIVALAFAGVVVLAGMWILRERLKSWAAGWR